MLRYWFEFDFTNYKEIPPGVKMGCGLTAFTQNQALEILEKKVFKKKIPLIIYCIENVDISTLDAGHVLPNMKPPIY